MAFITASLILILATVLAIAMVSATLRVVLFVMCRSVPAVSQGTQAQSAGIRT